MPSTDTVIVACNLPQGFIMTVYDMVDSIEPSPAGGRKIKVAQKVGRSYRINGTSTPWIRPEMAVVHGYALTRNIPRDFYNQWRDANEDAEMVKNRCVFASSNDHLVIDEAHDYRVEGVLSGLEPLDPKNLPRGMSLRGMRIEMADEQSNIPLDVDPDKPDPTRVRQRTQPRVRRRA